MDLQLKDFLVVRVVPLGIPILTPFFLAYENTFWYGTQGIYKRTEATPRI